LIITSMVINMDESRLRSIAQLQEFLSATAQVAFSAEATANANDAQRYVHISRVLLRLDYAHLGKHDRAVVLAYLRHTSGYSRAQVTRLVAQWSANRAAALPLVKRRSPPRVPFARKYTAADVALLVEMDRAFEDICGPAIGPLCKRSPCGATSL
jgi:hypothetical protein